MTGLRDQWSPEQIRDRIREDHPDDESMRLSTETIYQACGGRKIAAGVPVYFCDPVSPWQHGSNKNTNGRMRRYFPKDTDLTTYGPENLEHVAQKLNGRPRKTLGWNTPAERLPELVWFTWCCDDPLNPPMAIGAFPVVRRIR